MFKRAAFSPSSVGPLPPFPSGGGRGGSVGGGVPANPRPPTKGNRVNIPGPGRGYFCGDANELRDVGEGPEKSSLFFLTVDAQASGGGGRLSPPRAAPSTTPESG